MAAGIYHFIIEQGSTLVKQFTYQDATGTIVDLDGFDVRMQIRDTLGAPTWISSFTTASGGGLVILKTVSSSNSGTIQLTIPATETAGYSFINAVYDIEIEHTGSNTVTRLLQGAIRLSPEVTRPST
jgi:hypothetical protein